MDDRPKETILRFREQDIHADIHKAFYDWLKGKRLLMKPEIHPAPTSISPNAKQEILEKELVDGLIIKLRRNKSKYNEWKAKKARDERQKKEQEVILIAIDGRD